MSSASDSFIEATHETETSPSSPSEIDSLPSSPTTSSLASSADDGEETDAEREWKESLQQLELLLTMVVVPYVGKYFGRKCAYWGWAKFMEWKYPVEVVVTSEKAFKGTGAVEAAASL
ncbi:MAG: hypothetical protein LQ338_004180 [Usnochroma carphineum]|nr:MAG: hypothetical protein LQ338_004180 [Usnochroma carphineum]